MREKCRNKKVKEGSDDETEMERKRYTMKTSKEGKETDKKMWRERKRKKIDR